MTEAIEQTLLMMWARSLEEEIPELKLLFHPPNGGWRHKGTAQRLKRMGTKAGVPDLCLPVPRQGFHGLWIEMKWGSNRPTQAQRWWLEQLARQCYRVEICYSAEEAERVILEYLGFLQKAREVGNGRSPT